MNTIYEITAEVRPDLTETYEHYMRQRHIPDLLATGFFDSVKLTRCGCLYRIWYEANDLDGYLARDAARLRSDFLEHFPAGVELVRETWELIESWPEIRPR